MQIQLPQTIASSNKDLQVTTRDFRVIEGKSAFGVSVGDRVLGFAPESVASVSLRVADGRLHIQLQDQAGSALREVQVPSTELLRKDLRSLSDAGIFFSPKEVDELNQLLRLSMSGSVSKDEILLMLDEISHIAPSVEGGGGIDAGDLYPDLASQVRQLLTVMPDDIQRFVILNNIDRFGEDLWRTFHVISKIDPAQHPATTRFLAGDMPFNYQVEAELKHLLQESPLLKGTPLTRIDPDALQELMSHLSGKQVSGDYRTINFPQPLAKLIFENFNLEIPDFCQAPDFETLECNFMAQLKASHPLPGQAEDPLKKQLFQFLDTAKYKELAGFLIGKGNPPFTTEVQESLIHFLKNPPDSQPEQRLSSIAEPAYDRLMNLVRSRKLDVPGLLHGFPQLADQTDPADPVHLDALGRSFQKLDNAERLGFFVLDHLDPSNDRDLFNYFDGSKSGLSKLTPSLRRELESFLERKRFPEIREGIRSFSAARFQELVDLLEGFPQLGPPDDYLPANPQLRRAIHQLSGPEPSASETGPEKPPHIRPHRPSATAELAAEILESIKGLVGKERDERLTGLLKQHLDHFRQVGLLDQGWKGQRVLGEVSAGRMDPVAASRSLVATLNQMAELLSGEDVSPSWDLWQQPKQPTPELGRQNLQTRLLSQNENVDRYLQLDRQLTEKPPAFKERIEELSSMRRLEELADRLEKQITQNPGKLRNTLDKVAQTLDSLLDKLGQGEKGSWQFHKDSPLSQEKQAQFRSFRETVLTGTPADTQKLFEGPFLRPEFANSVERAQSDEMKRLEPLFNEALKRFETEPAKVLEKLMDQLVRPQEVPKGEAGARVQQLVQNLHDFNQHQNLNQQPMYLSLPLKLGDQESEMELAYFRLPNSGRNKRFLVVIHLDFDQWGHLRVDALKEDRQLSATFWVGNAKMQKHLQRDLHQLREHLSQKGIEEVHLDIKLEPERAERPVSELCVPRREGEVDVEI